LKGSFSTFSITRTSRCHLSSLREYQEMPQHKPGLGRSHRRPRRRLDCLALDWEAIALHEWLHSKPSWSFDPRLGCSRETRLSEKRYVCQPPRFSSRKERDGDPLLSIGPLSSPTSMNVFVILTGCWFLSEPKVKSTKAADV
jgi:hypothetical protein